MDRTAAEIIEASMPPTAALMDSERVAALIGTTSGTLRKWRCLKTGPPYVKDRGFVRYARAALIDWMVAKSVMPKSGVAD